MKRLLLFWCLFLAIPTVLGSPVVHAVDWTPRFVVRTMRPIKAVKPADGCDPWYCSFQDGDTIYCILEGERLDTPSASLICRCEAQGTDGCTFDLIIQ